MDIDIMSHFPIEICSNEEFSIFGIGSYFDRI